MDRSVALKILPPGVASDERAFQRFIHEARAAGRLDHPNVVHVHGLGIEEKTPYFAMELVEGETLAQILARGHRETPFGDPEVDQGYYIGIAKAFVGVAEGLQHAHSLGVIHRHFDLTP